MSTFLLEKKTKLPFNPTPGVAGECNDSIFAFMLLWAQLPLIWYVTWLLSERYSLTFWPHPLGRGCVCGQNICYHVAASVVSFNLICNMTTFRKIYSLTFWPHPLGQGYVCGQNICYHVAASVVSFNLICNMTIFWKSLILASARPLSPPNGLRLRPSNWNPIWYVSYVLLLCLQAKFQQKISTIALVNVKLKYLTFDPLGEVKGGGVYIWHCQAYLQALGNHGL